MEVDEHKTKFRVKADLELFQIMQRDGKLSEHSMALATDIPSTTVHYAMQRLKERKFFNIKAVPRLEKFQEIPMAVIGFTNMHPLRLNELKREYGNASEMLQFLHDEKSVLMFVMEDSGNSLTKKLFDIMKLAGEKPCLYIRSPSVVKNDVVIPDRILDAVYENLPDRRTKS